MPSGELAAAPPLTTPSAELGAASSLSGRAASSADEALVRRVRAGDSVALEGIFQEFWEPLCRFAFRYLRSADDAEEAVQTVFSRIWRGRTDWRLAGTLADYLYLATRNAARDRLKHDAVSRRWRERSVQEFRTGDDPSPPDALLEIADLEAAVERSLAQLPEKRRAICELRLTSGLTYAEIANRLGIAPKTVETQLARGLKFVRAHLRQFRD